MGIGEQVLEMLKHEFLEEGKREGKNELKETLVRKYVLSYGFTDKQIADMLDVTLKFVKHIRNQGIVKC